MAEMDRDTGLSDEIAGAYETYAEALHRFARSRLRDTSAAEDVVQEAYLRLATESLEGRYPARPQAWLYRVVLNLIISGARRSAVAQRQRSAWASQEATFDPPEVELLALERARELRAILANARPDRRRGLELVAQGYSSLEIAALIGRSQGATRTLLCRARKDVRRTLTDHDAAFGTG